MSPGSPLLDEPGPEQRDQLATLKLKEEFPLFLFEEFDTTFPNLGWIIGMKSDYPEELFRRVAAASVSVALGSKSVDYICKRYTNSIQYRHEEARLDKAISAWIIATHKVFLDCLQSITERDERNFGRVLFEWTLLRFPFAAKHMLSCANRGSIFEVAVLARMGLEQIAWAWCIDDATDDDAIEKTSATKAIRSLSKHQKRAGRLYGWLSEYAHWSPTAHARAMINHRGKLGIQFASSLYKAQAYVLLLTMTAIACQALLEKREEMIVQKAKPDDIAKLRLVDISTQKWLGKITTIQSDATLSKLALILAESG